MTQRLDYATPPAPVPPEQTETYSALRAFNILGIVGGIAFLALSAFFTVQDWEVGSFLFGLWAMYAVAEIVLLLITVCLKGGLRRLPIVGFAVVLVSGLRLWLEAVYRR